MASLGDGFPRGMTKLYYLGRTLLSHDEVVVTHAMGFARELADRLAFMDHGRVVEQGPPDGVLVDPRGTGPGRSSPRGSDRLPAAGQDQTSVRVGGSVPSRDE